uniref:C-type lectin domain-containing protein n=1 Tax=Caenorhabditis tropicalis TaxID=1561998 RepID=A0A1I7UDW2_9PELO
MKKLFLVFCFFLVVLGHKRSRQIKKFVEFDSSQSAWSSSWSSEEDRRPRKPQKPKGPRCDAGWLQFERPNGVWCILIGNPNVLNGWYSQQDAQNACTSLGAILTGFQNNNERMTVAQKALEMTTGAGRTVAGLWLGAISASGSSQWTDGQTTGIEGFKWGVGEPDSNNWPANPACIQQFIISPNFVAGAEDFASWKTYFANGDLDRYQCGSQAYPRMRLYACGKKGV